MKPLIWNESLFQITLNKAEDMAKNGKMEISKLNIIKDWKRVAQKVGLFGEASKSSDYELVQKLFNVIGGEGDQKYSLLDSQVE